MNRSTRLLRARALVLAALAVAAVGCGGDETVSDGFLEPSCVCDDGDQCTEDRCQADGSCLFVPVMPELACLYDSHCHHPDQCISGHCEPLMDCGFSRCTVEGLDCDDGDACTLDVCEPGSGCVHHRQDGGQRCTSAVECDDGDACTDDTCDEIIGCGSFCVHSSNGCVRCTVPDDCGYDCQARECVDGVCVYGETDPHCDYSCYPPASGSPDSDADVMAYRGIAAPIDRDCAGCACSRELVLRGATRDLTMTIDTTRDGTPFGECLVDVCAEEVSCSPLREGRGWVVTGGEKQAADVIGRELVGPYILRVDHYCLAVHSDLMIGDWRMTLTLDDGTVTSFDAVVSSADAGPTRFEIAGTRDGIGIPAQTLLLPNGGFRLETRLATDRGEFSGPLYSGADAIAGYLFAADGARAELRIALP